MTVNFNSFSPTHQGNQCINQEGSISNAPEDQTTALVSEMANIAIASAACSQSSSVKSLSNEIVCKLYNGQHQVEYQEFCIKALEKDSYLLKEGITSTIDLVTPLPNVLQKQEEYITILDLLRKEFPLLTKSLFKKETEIPKFVVSSSLNHESKLNSPLQIQAKGEIAYIAWDASSSEIIKGFKKHTCDIPFGLEKAIVIGVLITELPSPLGSLFDRRIFYVSSNSDSDEDNYYCIRKLPYIGRDRQKKTGETLYPFYLEIVPKFSSIQTSNSENGSTAYKGIIKKQSARSS